MLCLPPYYQKIHISPVQFLSSTPKVSMGFCRRRSSQLRPIRLIRYYTVEIGKFKFALKQCAPIIYYLQLTRRLFHYLQLTRKFTSVFYGMCDIDPIGMAVAKFYFTGIDDKFLFSMWQEIFLWESQDGPLKEHLK